MADTSPHDASGYGRAGRAAGIACLAALALAATPACSVRKFAINKVANVLSRGGEVYASDDDPDLVAQALPFGLKTMESLLAESPEHRGLLLATCRGFTQYSYAFVDTEAMIVEPRDYDRAQYLRERALRLYLRARGYGLRGLELDHPGIARRLQLSPADAAAEARPDEIGTVFWTGAAWGAALSVGKDRPDLLADVDAVRALLRRALEIDESYENGAIHQTMIAIEALPEAMGGSLARATQHFERALELTGGKQAGPFVAYAENVDVARQDRSAFVADLEKALAIDPDAQPSTRLANLIAQRRARSLLGRVDELFLEPE